MAPIIHARDEDRAAARIGWRLVSAGIWAAPAVLLGLALFDSASAALRDHWLALLVLLSTPALAGLLVMAFHPAQGQRDWLRLDVNGITLSRRGNQAQWHWSRVAVVRSYAWWHPIGLVFGASLRIDLAGGGRVVISDDYFTPLDEILGRMREARARALGLEGFAGRALPSISAPALVAEGPRIFRRQGVGWGPLDATALAGAAFAVTGFLLQQVSSMDRGDLLEWGRTIAAAMATAIFSLVFSGPKWVRGATAAGNFLLLSDDGLHLRHQGSGRHWRWPDVSGFALVRREADSEAGTDMHRLITFTTRGSGGGRAGPADGEVHEIEIEEAYDVPLEEILRRLEAWHAWAGATEVTVTEEPGAEALFSVKPRPGIGGVLANGAICLSLGPSLVLTAAFVGLLVFLGTTGRTTLGTGLWISVVVVTGLIPLVPILLSAWLAKRFALEADGEGLALRRLGVTRRWSWDSLSAIESRDAETRWIGTRHRLLVIEAAEDDRLSRLTRWAYRLESGRPAVVIEDIFDRPLEEIAGRLEALRRAAPAAAVARRREHRQLFTPGLAGEGAL